MPPSAAGAFTPAEDYHGGHCPSSALRPFIAPTDMSPPRSAAAPHLPRRLTRIAGTLALVLTMAANFVTPLAAAAAATSPTATLKHADHALIDQLWDVAQQRHLSREELLARLVAADVVLLGETHDNPVHHQRQDELLAALLAAGRQPVVVMEQFDIEQQAALDAATGADAAAALMPRGWEVDQYRPLLERARAAGLPLVAGNVARSSTRPVVREGWQSIDPERRARLQLDAVWDERRETYMSKVITASHCGKIDAPLRDGLVRAQRLRDAVLAEVAQASLARGAVYIVGRGHARSDVGVPRYLAARNPQLKIVSLGFTEVAPDKRQPADYHHDDDGQVPPGNPHDVLWFTPRQTRPDPCANFGKS